MAESPKRRKSLRAREGSRPRFENRSASRRFEDRQGIVAAIIEEQEATNEELKSANEEIQPAMKTQSTNEELETRKKNCNRRMKNSPP